MRKTAHSSTLSETNSSTRLTLTSAFERSSGGGGGPRGFLGNRVSVRRVLGIVVPTGPYAHVHFRLHSTASSAPPRGKETCEFVYGGFLICGGSGFLRCGGVPRWDVIDGLGPSVDHNCQL